MNSVVNSLSSISNCDLRIFEIAINSNFVFENTDKSGGVRIPDFVV